MAFDLLSFLLGKSIGSGGGGGSAALGPKTIRQNGVYHAASDNLDGYNTVTVEVPNTYAAADEGKVVSNGALVAQTSRTFTENGTYDTTLNDEVVVNVSGGDSYDAARKLAENTLTEYIDADLTIIRPFAFYQKSALATFIAHNVTSIQGGWLSGSNAANSPAVQYVAFPKVISIGGNGSNNNYNLKGYDFTALVSIALYGFSSNRNLNVLILRKNTVVTLSAINAFNDTPFASNGTGGTLYVPQALIASYQAATNWSTLLGYANNQILPIEGSIYETQYADGTPIAA